MFRLRSILMLKKKKEISELKATGILKQYLTKLFNILIFEPQNLILLIHQIFNAIKKNGCKSRNKHKKTAFKILGIN